MLCGFVGYIYGTRFEFKLDEDRSLLQSLEKNGVSLVKVGCRGGGCGRCKVHIISGPYETGKMSAKHVSSDDLKQGNVLACRCFPKGNLVFEPIKIKR